MKTLIIYESMFGNTRDVAMAIAEGLQGHTELEAIEVASAPDMIPTDIDLLIAGGPTHQFGMSRASSREQAAKQQSEGLVSAGRGIREWLDVLEAPGNDLAVATFDTTMEKPGFLKYFGRASTKIAASFKRRGFRQIAPPESFLVTSGNGPLADGEIQRAREWAAGLVTEVASQPEVKSGSRWFQSLTRS